MVATKPLGYFIRRTRRDLDLTLDAVADVAGLSKSYLSLVESGKRLPGLETLQMICVALHVTMHELIYKWEMQNG